MSRPAGRPRGRCWSVVAAAAALSAAGCAIGPRERRPDLPPAGGYVEAPLQASLAAQRQVVQADLPERWWTLFHCPALDDLVRRGLADNPTVASARAALRVAVENRKAQEAAFLPSLSLGYSATRQKVADPVASPVASDASLYTLHTAELDVAYTPDLLGINRRQVESLQAQADSQRWSAEATYLTLTSNIVVAAITQASLRAQVEATRRLVAAQADVVQRYRSLQALGQNSRLDLAQQEAQLASLEADLPPLEKQLALQGDQLKALLGATQDSPAPTPIRLDELTLPEPLPLTLPSTLLGHRPDILAAEEQLRVASAAIGIAAANRLPSVTLGVNSWGSSAYSIASLFGPGTSFWTLTGSLSQTLFDGGALKHREAAARASYDEAVGQYRSTVLNAYQNVADALQAIDADARALAVAQRAQDAAERALALVAGQLGAGDTSTLALLSAQQSVHQATVATVQAQANRMTDAAALLQALGGGWWNRPADTPPAAGPDSAPAAATD